MLKPKSDQDRQTDRQTVGLGFSWESVLTHICLSPWHPERDNYEQWITRSDLPHIYLWMDETVYKWIYVRLWNF